MRLGLGRREGRLAGIGVGACLGFGLGARAALVYGADFPPLPDDGGDAVELYLVDRTPAQEAADIEEAASADGEEETVEGPAETGEDLDAMHV